MPSFEANLAACVGFSAGMTVMLVVFFAGKTMQRRRREAEALQRDMRNRQDWVRTSSSRIRGPLITAQPPREPRDVAVVPAGALADSASAV